MSATHAPQALTGLFEQVRVESPAWMKKCTAMIFYPNWLHSWSVPLEWRLNREHFFEKFLHLPSYLLLMFDI